MYTFKIETISGYIPYKVWYVCTLDTKVYEDPTIYKVTQIFPIK